MEVGLASGRGLVEPFGPWHAHAHMECVRVEVVVIYVCVLGDSVLQVYVARMLVCGMGVCVCGCLCIWGGNSINCNGAVSGPERLIYWALLPPHWKDERVVCHWFIPLAPNIQSKSCGCLSWKCVWSLYLGVGSKPEDCMMEEVWRSSIPEQGLEVRRGPKIPMSRKKRKQKRRYRDVRDTRA